MATNPNVLVVKLPGLAGGQGKPGADGVSAVNNIVNPTVSTNVEFRGKTEITALTYSVAPSITLTFEATLVVKGLVNSTAIIYVEGPIDSVVSGIMTYPYSAAPQPSGNSASFGIQGSDSEDYYVVKLAGSIRNGNSSGIASISLENLSDVDGGYVAAGSFVQWSIPVIAVLNTGSSGPVGATNGLTKAQADQIYAAKTDTRFTDKRAPLDQSVNANTITPAGLPISSIDNLREELDSTVKTINGISPDVIGNVNVLGGTVGGFNEGAADQKYVKVPNAALDISKVNGLNTIIDTLIAQNAALAYRVQQMEQNGVTPGGGTVGSGYPAVYPALY
jgi:hypothetical protein